MTSSEQDLLLASGLPIFFEIDNFDELDLSPTDNRHGQSVRVWARSLSVMQKEAIVASARSGKAWRLASDEGPYLDGVDSAPCPLSFLTTGMVSSYFNEIQALARQRDINIRDLVLIQDNYYTMEGSALRGTMIGGALPVDLEVQIDCDADDAGLNELLVHAVHASPLNGLMRKVHESLFTLTMNGSEIGVGEVASINAPAEKDPGDRFALISAGNDTGRHDELIRRIDKVAVQDGVAGGAGTSLQASQSRQLHVRARCRLRPDGVKEITQDLLSPLGSRFRFLSDETEEFGGQDAAPDAVTYMSAGIAFCFMTQLGRYAKIVKKNLDEYKVIQDTHFSLGGASGRTGQPGVADPVETHTYLDTSEEAEFARKVLDMGERTCFLHAFCRTELKTKIKIRRT
ncbi:MAG: OsmC family peroxiredoxin [Gammaproteobacteria bacterium]|nr:OsmC family peroxiredoxin [Gammaproteobacteria bacterium]MXW44706.1 OsmC family peroxiredoxin [Gammaproteobacteria bacterium]MYD02403.1 OsmC family peroxiredoxin [Gammaproteobacteria bacterium]MYI24867.1 OsmC family peroxiredoxin [Gammaproteobacteria bacterium]